MNKREFIKNSAKVALSLPGAALLGYPIWRFLAHSGDSDTSVVFQPEEALLKVNFKKGVFLLKGDNEFHALSARCTHLGCTVAFDETKQEFHCPCHGSVYDKDGERLSGPARQPLARLPVRRERNGDLVATREG